MADREENNEPEQEQATSEGQGEDIGPYRKKGPDDDSNEEDKDDPEEARRRAEGFVANADDDGAEGEKKKKSKGKKNRRRECHSSAELEDDDLELLLENTHGRQTTRREAVKVEAEEAASPAESSQRPGSSDDEEIPAQDLQHIFDDMPRRSKEGTMMDNERDDMADFTEKDDGLGGDNEEAERARRKESKRRHKNKQLGTMQGGEGGIDQVAWDDVYDVFGSGDEHDWVLEDEAQQMGGFKEGEKLDMHDVFEPSEIQRWWGRDGNSSGVQEEVGGANSDLGPLAFYKAAKDLQTTSNQPSILSVFPTELLLDIISFVADKPTLSALSQTSSGFCELASPALYENMTLSGSYGLVAFVEPTTSSLLLSSLRPRTSVNKVETLSIRSHERCSSIRPRGPYPILPFPSLKSLVIRCDHRCGDSDREDDHRQGLIHDCADLLSSLQPSYVTFQSDVETDWPTYYSARGTDLAKILFSPFWTSLISVTFVSLVIQGLEHRPQGPNCRWIWDYSDVKDGGLIFDSGGGPEASWTEPYWDIVDLISSLGGDKTIVLRKDHEAFRQELQRLAESGRLSLVIKE